MARLLFVSLLPPLAFFLLPSLCLSFSSFPLPLVPLLSFSPSAFSVSFSCLADRCHEKNEGQRKPKKEPDPQKRQRPKAKAKAKAKDNPSRAEAKPRAQAAGFLLRIRGGRKKSQTPKSRKPAGSTNPSKHKHMRIFGRVGRPERRPRILQSCPPEGGENRARKARPQGQEARPEARGRKPSQRGQARGQRPPGQRPEAARPARRPGQRPGGQSPPEVRP